jgi:hypothetical protein
MWFIGRAGMGSSEILETRPRLREESERRLQISIKRLQGGKKDGSQPMLS